jgi:hypothetical protein
MAIADLMLGLVMLFGGSSLPLGVPPMPEDSVLSCAAPEECLAYMSWSGTAKPAADSPNQTEQLLAEPEVAQLFTKIEAVLLEKAGEAAKHDLSAKQFTDAYPAAKAVLTRPAAVFVSKVSVLPQGPDVAGGAIFKLDADGPMVVATLENLQKMMPPGAVEKTVIDRFSVYKIKTPGPLVTWGLAGKYLVVGVGAGAFETILARARGEKIPAWLTSIRKQAPVERVSTVGYVNVKQIVTQFAPMGGPQVKTVLDATGLAGVTSMASVTGLDKAGFVSQTLIGIDGEPSGVMRVISGKPLTPADLAPIPRDATFAVAARYDLSDVLATATKVAGQIDQRTAEEATLALKQISDSTGVSVEDDLLKSLGDVWCVYNSPGEGGFLVTGVTAVAQVKDRARLAAALDKLVTLANSQFERRAGPGNMPPPKIEKLTYAGKEIYYVNARTPEFPVAPAWCLTEKELVVSIFPQNVKSYLSRGKDFQSLAAAPEVAAAFASGDGPAVISFVDAKPFAEVFYPMLCLGAQALVGQAAREGVPLDISLLPSANALLPHLRPGVATLRRTSAGIELSSHGTIPSIGGGIGAMAGLFVGYARPARMVEGPFSGQRAVSMNNLKQIALAVLNYESTFNKFPAAYTADKATGKPLLSWRVAILPYIEQDALYRQFHLDEPWDSPNNKKLVELMPSIYRSPASHLAGRGMTNYVTFRSKDSAFPGKDQISMRDITDGTSNTLMAVEVDDSKAVIWTKPDDLDFNAQNPHSGLGGLWQTGFVAALCDGSVRFIPAGVDAATLKNLVSRADGNVIDWSAVEGKQGMMMKAVPSVRKAPPIAPPVQENRTFKPD